MVPFPCQSPSFPYTNPTKPSQSPSFPSTRPDEHHPNPKHFFQILSIPFPSISTGLKSETQVKKEKVHSSTAARCGGTWDLAPVDFFLRDFFCWIFFFGGIGPCGLAPPPPLECNSILPLVTVVLITPKGAEPPDSRRIGVIGALVLILPSETV